MDNWTNNFLKNDRKNLNVKNQKKTRVRPFEDYIINYFRKKQLTRYIKNLKIAFLLMPDNSLTAFKKYVDDNFKKPSLIEKKAIYYFKIYDIDKEFKTRSQIRKKENKQKNLLRVEKYKEKKALSNKVLFSAYVHQDFKRELNSIKTIYKLDNNEDLLYFLIFEGQNFFKGLKVPK